MGRLFFRLFEIIFFLGLYFFFNRGNIKFNRGRASTDQYAENKHPGAQKKNDKDPACNFSACQDDKRFLKFRFFAFILFSHFITPIKLSQFYILSGAETPNNVKPLRMTF